MTKASGIGQLCLMILLITVSVGYRPYCEAAEWSPTKNVEIIVGSGPGAGLDNVVRMISQVLRDTQLVKAPMIVINRPGAGLAISFAYLNRNAGDGHYLAITSPNLVLNKILGSSPISHTDFVPIAQLTGENIAFAVKADSDIRDALDLIEKLKRDPSSITIAVSTSLGGANHLAAGLVMQKAGIDVQKARFIPYKSGGDVAAALLGGHVGLTAISASVLMKQFEAGNVRIIAVSSPQRVGGALATVPTWTEVGVNAVFTNWRGIIAPRATPQPQINYWDAVFEQLVKTPEWNKQLNLWQWRNEYKNSTDSRKFLADQAEELSLIATSLGLVPGQANAGK